MATIEVLLNFQAIAAYLALGGVVGLMAGLLGIGGGGIMVPVLTSLFLWQGVPEEQVVHQALGTSMAAIVVTSIASLRAHHRRGGVVWPVVQRMAGGVVLGAFAATFVVAAAASVFLAVFFLLFMGGVALQLLRNRAPTPGRQLWRGRGLFAAGSAIGAVSALVSIGGGSLTVPFLIWQNVDTRKAIGTSAALGLPLSLAGTAGFIMAGWNAGPAGSQTLGFVYVPAVIAISLMSISTAPLGVAAAHRLPVSLIKKVFALLLILLSLKMLFALL